MNQSVTVDNPLKRTIVRNGTFQPGVLIKIFNTATGDEFGPVTSDLKGEIDFSALGLASGPYKAYLYGSGFVGSEADTLTFVITTSADSRLQEFANLLANSIYKYMAIELFQNTGYSAVGAQYVDTVDQQMVLKSGEVYQSSNMKPNPPFGTAPWADALNTNEAVIVVSYSGSIAPTVEITQDPIGDPWQTLTSGSGYKFTVATQPKPNLYFRLTGSASGNVITAVGLFFVRKTAYATRPLPAIS